MVTTDFRLPTFKHYHEVKSSNSGQMHVRAICTASPVCHFIEVQTCTSPFFNEPQSIPLAECAIDVLTREKLENSIKIATPEPMCKNLFFCLFHECLLMLQSRSTYPLYIQGSILFNWTTAFHMSAYLHTNLRETCCLSPGHNVCFKNKLHGSGFYNCCVYSNLCLFVIITGYELDQ